MSSILGHILFVRFVICMFVMEGRCFDEAFFGA